MSEAPDGFDLSRYLAAAARWEPALDAWAHREAPADLQQGGHADGPLAGVPFGVKDVIDVRGQPTRFGSNAFADAEPAVADAPVVRALRASGAVPVGKTRSTEFAFIDPTTTRNPFDRERSPGGSSSGSGAAVGARVVPFALGTQTAGSLCRPATYCGALSYKPGLGVLPQTGMAPLSHSFDAIGVIAATPGWLRRVFSVLAADFAIPTAPATDRPLSIGLLNVPEQSPGPGMRQVMSDVARVLGEQGHGVTRVECPVSFPDMIDRHRTVMLHEMARNLTHVVQGKEEFLQPRFRNALADGALICDSVRDEAMNWIAQARAAFWPTLSGFDVLLSCPVPDAAPKGLATTGDQSYLTPWTALGGPLVSLPAGLDADGMPLGILLSAAPGRDGFLVSAALRISTALPATAAPTCLPLPA
ncbi:MAG: amidase [Minwuia sp.]|nr:amidase [Minwuia sp.]